MQAHLFGDVQTNASNGNDLVIADQGEFHHQNVARTTGLLHYLDRTGTAPRFQNFLVAGLKRLQQGRAEKLLNLVPCDVFGSQLEYAAKRIIGQQIHAVTITGPDRAG